MKTAAQFWWASVPAACRRFSLTLSVALSDGDYLRAWPRIAALVPAGAVLLGLAIGALHPGPVYSSSEVVLGLLALIAGFGAGPGCWAWLGFVVGDLALADHSSLPTVYDGSDVSLPEQLLHQIQQQYLPLGLAYLLLWALLGIGPLLGGAARWGAVVMLRRAPQLAPGVGATAQIAAQAGYVYCWAQSTAFLIRPVWSYSGSTPNLPDIAPLQSSAGWLAGVTALVVAVRVGLEAAARPRMPRRRPTPPPRPKPLMLRVVGQTTLLTLVLSGLISGVVQYVLLIVVLAAIVILRLGVMPRLAAYVKVIQRVPAALRMAICLAVGYQLTQWFVVPSAEGGEQSFVPMVTVIVISMVVGAVLLPGVTLTREENSSHHGRRAHR